MSRFPFVTGADGKRYPCQLRQSYQDEYNQTVYTFLLEYSDELLSIKKIDEDWIFVSGETYRESWIEDLGDFVDQHEEFLSH